ncbi:MAG TPA: sigma 54-interacting transcriptional regulator [Polyangiaceae bacterium]
MSMGKFRLRIERGAGPRAELVVRNDRVTIGRGDGAEFVVDDDGVSDVHCEIRHTTEGFVIRDLDSEQGTWISGIRVREARLPEETRVLIGDTELSFSTLEAPEEPASRPGARFFDLIGDSHPMRLLFARLARAATLTTTLFLEGESGTGKDLAARAVHDAGSRRDGPFVVVDCSFPRARVEEELFGRDAGGAPSEPAAASAFVRAHGGTLYLDEVGGLDLEVQPLLLRALEAHEVKPTGALEPVLVDVRIIASTHQDLKSRIRHGAFRDDLYYRLAVTRIRMPPLRERNGDVPLLVAHFLSQHSSADEATRLFDEAAIERLRQRTWPGNVRELRNAVEQVLAFGDDEPPSSSDEPISDLRRRGSLRAARRSEVTALPFKRAKSQVVERFEREYLAAILEQCGGNITAAAATSELDRVHFLRLMDRHGMRRSKPKSV